MILPLVHCDCFGTAAAAGGLGDAALAGALRLLETEETQGGQRQRQRQTADTLGVEAQGKKERTRLPPSSTVVSLAPGLSACVLPNPMTKMNKTVRLGAKSLRKDGETYKKIGERFKVALAGWWWWGRVGLDILRRGFIAFGV